MKRVSIIDPTFIINAAKYGHVDVIKVLLSYCPSVFVNYALYEAASHEHRLAVSYLLQQGANCEEESGPV